MNTERMGSRTAQRILQTPGANLQPDQQQQLQYRVKTARWTPEARVVYDAVREGFGDRQALQVATGLTDAQLERAIDFLTKAGEVRLALQEE